MERVATAWPAVAEIDIDGRVIGKVCAHSWEIDDDRNANGTEMICGAEAGAHQQHWASVGAGANDDVIRLDDRAVDESDASRSGSVEDDVGNLRIRFDRQIRGM